MKIKKSSFITIVCAALLIGSISTIFATSAIGSNTSNNGEAIAIANNSGANNVVAPTQDELIVEYGEFGITFNSDGKILFNNELVRYFYDGIEISSGVSSVRYDYFNIDGKVDVFTKREVVENSKEGTDPFGNLISLHKSSQNDFDARDTSQLVAPQNPIAHTDGINAPNTEPLSKILKKFEAFGVSFEQGNTESGYGNIYYNGVLVKTLVDSTPDGNVLTYSSKEDGKIVVYATYDSDGKLIGVKEK